MNHNGKEEKRRLKTSRRTSIVMATLCMIAIGFLFYAFDQKNKVDEFEELYNQSEFQKKELLLEIDSLKSVIKEIQPKP